MATFPTTTEPTARPRELPQALVRIEPGKTCWILRVLECPVCGARAGTRYAHKHGGGPLDAPPSLGARSSHCMGTRWASYELVAEGE